MIGEIGEDQRRRAAQGKPVSGRGSERRKRRRKPDPLVCPHCGAKFHKPMKFCGECGKAMS